MEGEIVSVCDFVYSCTHILISLFDFGGGIIVLDHLTACVPARGRSAECVCSL